MLMPDTSQNPTYEDMLLLSSLLGPAKPLVASREDVASASGTFCIKQSADVLVAEAIRGMSQIQIGPNERCLVCLEEYRAEEEVRQLKKCSHLFHRDCIDVVCHDTLPITVYFDTDNPNISGSLPGAIPALFVEDKGLTRIRKLGKNAELRPCQDFRQHREHIIISKLSVRIVQLYSSSRVFVMSFVHLCCPCKRFVTHDCQGAFSIIPHVPNATRTA